MSSNTIACEGNVQISYSLGKNIAIRQDQQKRRGAIKSSICFEVRNSKYSPSSLHASLQCLYIQAPFPVLKNGITVDGEQEVCLEILTD